MNYMNFMICRMELHDFCKFRDSQTEFLDFHDFIFLTGNSTVSIMFPILTGNSMVFMIFMILAFNFEIFHDFYNFLIESYDFHDFRNSCVKF